jgi:hypothetical protein
MKLMFTSWGVSDPLETKRVPTPLASVNTVVGARDTWADAPKARNDRIREKNIFFMRVLKKKTGGKPATGGLLEINYK